MSHMFKVLLNEERREKRGWRGGLKEENEAGTGGAAALLPSDMCGGPRGGETSEPGRRSEM